MFPHHRNFWKAGPAGDAETDDEPDFYFTSSPPPPPSAVGVPRTSSASMHTPDTSFNVFEDSNSLDTTPRIGKKTRKGAEQDEPGDSLLFPSSFPSEEFLSEMSQQLEKHSVNSSTNHEDRGGGVITTTVGLDGFAAVPGFDSPSLESLTLNPFPNDGNLNASDSFTTATSKSASFVAASSPHRDRMAAAMKGPSTPTKQGMAGTCGLSPIPIRGAAAFDPFALVGDSQGGDTSPLHVWANRAKQTLAKVTASESHDECGGNADVSAKGSNVKEMNLFSKDLIGTDFESGADASRNDVEVRKAPVVAPPPTVSPPKTTAQPSLYSTANKGDGGDDEVPSLEWSFTSHQSFASTASSSGAASRAGQFLSHVVGRCYGCSDDDVDVNANHREQQKAYLVQQLHEAKQKSASVVDEAVRVVVTLLGDTVPAMVVAMTSKASSRHRHSGDDPFRAARRHRRFPSASTFDYSESQNPTTTGEMSHYTTSDGEGTSFDDEYYDDEDDDEEEYEGDEDEDDDDATQSSARGGSAAGGGSFDTGRRDGADVSADVRHGDAGDDDGSDVYSPPIKNAPPTNRPPRGRPERIRKGSGVHRKHVESVSPSFKTDSSSWMKDPLAKVNQGVHKLFGEASVAMSHHPPSAAKEPHRRRREREELERAKDRFAC